MEKLFNNDEDDSNVNATTTSFPPPYVPEPKGYALSGKIMLSAIIILLAVVIIMVSLHIYARWYMRRVRRRTRQRTHLVFYIDPNDPSSMATSQNRGLDASLLNSLPTFVYGKDTDIKVSNGEEVLECAVCLCEFEEDEGGRMLPKCGHRFHMECIDMWFHSHATCPLCRAPVEAADLVQKGDEVVLELSELTRSQPANTTESKSEVGVGPSQVFEGPSASLGGRRKGLDLVGVTVEVPMRYHSFSFTNSDESGPSGSPGQGFKSPTSRILSLKRILSREKRSGLPSTCSETSRVESDVESGCVDPATIPSQTGTPR